MKKKKKKSLSCFSRHLAANKLQTSLKFSASEKKTGQVPGPNVSICVNGREAVAADIVCWVNLPWIKKTKNKNV